MSKATQKFEAMTKQTFGVEVEMAGITREAAAKLASVYFKTGRYAHTAREDRYDIWSAYDEAGRKWKFSSDCSIGDIGERQCEMVTPVLKYEDMEMLQGLIRELRKAGAKSSPAYGCGVHIHVGGDGHTVQSIKVLCEMMRRYENELSTMIGIESFRLRRYCKTINPTFLTTLLTTKPSTMRELEDVWYTSQHCTYGRHEHYNDSRYHMLNLHAFFNRYNTIEFRLFQFDDPTEDRKGGLHAGQLKAMIQLCLAMSNYAKTVSYCSTYPKTEIDEVTSMTNWMVKMGMTGKEFKTARDYFTRNASKDRLVKVAPMYLTSRSAREHGTATAQMLYL